MSKTLPGLKSFFMAGQWVEPAAACHRRHVRPKRYPDYLQTRS